MKGNFRHRRKSPSKHTSAARNVRAVAAAARSQPRIAMPAGRLAAKIGATAQQITNRSTAASHAARPSRSAVWKTQLAESDSGSEKR